MKNILKRIAYRSPELTASLGFAILMYSAGSDDAGVRLGNGAPEWTAWASLIGLTIFGIGVLLCRVREEVNRAKK